MKYLLIAFAVLLSFDAEAQNSKIKKLYKQFEKGNVSKSEKLAKAILSKNKADPDANFILGLIAIRETKNTKSSGKQKRLVKDAIAKQNAIDQNLPQYTQLSDSLKTIIYFLLKSEKLTYSAKKYFVATLASEYNDTLSIYWDLFEKGSKTALSTTTLSDQLYPQDSLRRVLLSLAQELEGTPYKWAGESPKTGFDCSGFTSYVYKSVGIKLPHNAQKQSELIKNRKTLEEAIPGDLIFFGSQSENGFYTRHAGIIFSIEGESIEVVHCVSNGVNIEGKDSSWDRYWINEVLFVVDVFSNNGTFSPKN